MKKLYSPPAICHEPLEVMRGFLFESHEGYDVDPFNPGFINSEYIEL